LTPASATGKAKVLLLQKREHQPNEKHAVASFNELVPTSSNRIVTHHMYNGAMVDALLAIAPTPEGPDRINALATALPRRFLLPGDVCWATQAHTSHCGPFSFAAAMNYWHPFTNNRWKQNGEWYVDRTEYLPGGARTPKFILDAAEEFGMQARINRAEKLERVTADKLLKLWILAGVPVMFLVAEEAGDPTFMPDFHWKLAVGYDGDRLFLENSGADLELSRPGATDVYWYAPVGNDVDLWSDHDPKWEKPTKGVAGAIADVFTSVAARTFIPVYPKDGRFRGTAVT
jgi:hypothetical protein